MQDGSAEARFRLRVLRGAADSVDPNDPPGEKGKVREITVPRIGLCNTAPVLSTSPGLQPTDSSRLPVVFSEEAAAVFGKRTVRLQDCRQALDLSKGILEIGRSEGWGGGSGGEGMH